MRAVGCHPPARSRPPPSPVGPPARRPRPPSSARTRDSPSAGFVVEWARQSLVHLGDLGHVLSPEQVKATCRPRPSNLNGLGLPLTSRFASTATTARHARSRASSPPIGALFDLSPFVPSRRLRPRGLCLAVQGHSLTLPTPLTNQNVEWPHPLRWRDQAPVRGDRLQDHRPGVGGPVGRTSWALYPVACGSSCARS